MKKSWLDRFSQAARWYLPRAEADDVISDYREMLAGDARSEEELCRDLGKPRQAARLLVQPKAYRMWLGVFAVLAVCLALPGLSPLPGVHPMFWNNLFGGYHLYRPLALLGMVGTIVWFRRKGRREEKLPRAIPIFLAVLLAWCALVMAFNWVWMHNPAFYWDILGQAPFWIRVTPYAFTNGWVSAFIYSGLEWVGGLGMVLAGLYALAKARTDDRRWAAVYVLAMPVMLVCLSTLGLMTSADITAPSIWDQFAPFYRSYAALAAAGLVGMGVALC